MLQLFVHHRQLLSYMYIHICRCVHIYTYTCEHVCLCVCVYVCMYLFIYPGDGSAFLRLPEFTVLFFWNSPFAKVVGLVHGCSVVVLLWVIW